MAMELTTLANVKQSLGVVGGASDTLLTRIIGAAEAHIRNLCGERSTFLTGTFTEYFNGNHSQVLRLRYAPVASITSITVAGSTVDATTYSLNTVKGEVGFIYPTQATRYSLAMPSGLYVTGQSFNAPSFGSNYNDVVVVYVGGYASQATVPADLEQATIDMATLMYKSRNRDPGLKSENLGDYSYVTADDGDAEREIITRLGPYMRGSIL